MTENTLIAGVELGQAPNRFRVEKHRFGFISYESISPIYAIIDADEEEWLYQHFNGVMRELFRDVTLDLDPDEYAALYALKEAK